VLIDISRLLDRFSRGRLPTGVDRVCLSYIQRWGEQSRATLQKGNWRRVLSHSASQRLFELVLNPGADFAQRMNRAVAQACVPPWPQQQVRGALSWHLGQTGLEKPGFEQWLNRSQQRPLYFVHDLIPLTHPEYCRPGEDVHHHQRMALVLRTAAGVVVNSQDTSEALQGFAHANRLPQPPTVVAPLAPAPLKHEQNHAPPLVGAYFIALGTIEPRKNHLLLLNVWRELVQRLGPAAPTLVIVGQRGWECEQVADMLDRCLALRGHVKEIPRCTDAELGHWLQHARALLFPSFVEGYGMPLVEALSVGTPVVASNLSVFAEVAGDVPDVLSPIDGEGWLQAVLDYSAESSPRRATQLQRMVSYRVSTWDDHFAAVEGLLGQLQTEVA
jgi:glycosyltransferase involved in cell wall biosynthesis